MQKINIAYGWGRNSLVGPVEYEALGLFARRYVAICPFLPFKPTETHGGFYWQIVQGQIYKAWLQEWGTIAQPAGLEGWLKGVVSTPPKPSTLKTLHSECSVYKA